MDNLTLTTLAPALRLAGAILITIALPVLLLAGALRSVALNDAFYHSEFAKYRVAAVTGLTDQQLARVAEALIAYFQSSPGRLDVRVGPPEGERPLLNEREIRHMQDVQILVQRVFQAGVIALLALIVGVAAIAAAGPGSAVPALLRSAALGGAVAAAAVGLLGLGSLLDFSRLFLQFHYLSFPNDLWILDPQRDRLIQLFPQGFFFDAAIQIGLRSAGLGATIALASWLALRFLKAQ